MDFFDKVVQGARDAANSAVKATSDLVDKGKQQIDLSKMRSDRRDLVVKLGEYTLAVRKGLTPVDTEDELIAQIADFDARIAAIDSEREQERQQKEADRAARSAAMGGPIEVVTETCKECGALRIRGSAFCGGCGKKYDE